MPGLSDSGLHFDSIDAFLPPPVVQPVRARRQPILPPMWIPAQGLVEPPVRPLPVQAIPEHREPIAEPEYILAELVETPASFRATPSTPLDAILPPMWIGAAAVGAPLPFARPDHFEAERREPILPPMWIPAGAVEEPSSAPFTLPLLTSPAELSLSLDDGLERSTVRYSLTFMSIFLASLATHLIVLIVLSTLNFTQDSNDFATILDATFTEEAEEVEQVVEIALGPLEEMETMAADPGDGEAIIAAEIEVGNEIASGVAVGEDVVQVDSVSEIDGLFGSNGTGMKNAGNGGKEGYAAQFFGVKATGKKFVFIVDNSGSMSGDKFTAAKKELAYAVSRLSKEQSFYVVFFNSEFEKMLLLPDEEPPASVVPATVPNIKKFGKWMDKTKTMGGTNPYEAVVFAMSLKPDAIFILSDGQFSDGGQTLQYLDNVNAYDDPAFGYSPRVSVHTIAFWERAGEATMKEIARLHKGTFRFVPEPPPKRK